MNVLSNITQASMGSYGGGGDSPHNPMYETKGQTRAGAGFTLLQGHIQLMAMVPNLPENQTSPREKASQSNEETSSLPITPRMMPSASKYKRPHLPSILAGKASQVNRYQSFPSTWQQPRSLSTLSLPPKQSQPITMPSFAKCLPGTKRAIGHGTAMIPGATYTTAGGQESNFNIQQYDFRDSQFPVIPTQPSFQAPANSVQMINTDNYQQQQEEIEKQQQQNQIPALTTAYMNPYTGAWMSPQMAYQMVNVIPSHQQQQQQYDYAGGSGDSAMASMIHQIQQQQLQQQTYQQATLAYPYQNYTQHVFGNDFLQYSQQPPYAVKSMPSFGTPCTSSNQQVTYAMHNFSMPAAAAQPNKTPGHNGLVLPPISVSASPQPVYSASMPEICFSTGSPHQNQAPVLIRRKGVLTAANAFGTCKNKEVSIVLEDSSSTSSTSSSSLSEDEALETLKKSAASKGSKSISVLKLREILKEKDEKKAKEDAKYAALGPESDPDKIPSNPRVAHTPTRIQPKKETPKEETGDKINESVDKCNGECCSHCKCCIKNNEDPKNYQQQQPKTLEEKVKEMKNKLTPRRKGKPVVVAVHDCFPSDSSVTDAESDVDLSRRSCFNYTGSNGAVVRKRKPRIDAILKTRRRGDSSEVFEDLENDLNPDEARTYTCDYLVELLTSEDWNNCYTALQIMIRLARHRPKILLSYLSGPILWCTFHHITSPKSALCRAAIVTFKELFQRIGSALDNDLEKITEKLVLKSLAPNMFIREECDRALEAMVANCNLVKVLNAMDIITKKPHARAAGHRLARMALQIVQVAGVDMCLKPTYAEKLLPMLFCFMTEANNGTRTAAKEALGMLMNHLQFETAVTRHVTFDKNCTEVFKKLDKMRGRNRSRRQMMGNARFPLPHAHFRR